MPYRLSSLFYVLAKLLLRLFYADSFTSYKCENTNHTHDQRNAGKQNYNFIFTHAAELEMVVDRAHPENALACGLKTDDLQNNGKGFAAVNKTGKKQDEFHVHPKTKRHNHAAQKQRTGVKDLEGQ